MAVETRSPVESSLEAPYAPLPLRARGAMELLDAAVKLYRQYFGVLLGWSAISALSAIVGTVVPGGGLLSFFLAPLPMGAVACCIAAAVRGQRVGFMQCWEFTKPRYWPLLGMSLLSGLILAAILIPLALVLVGVAVAGASLGSGSSVITAIGIAVVAVLFLLLAPYGYAWSGLVSVVVCFEDDKRNTQALSRAYEIPRGNWGRIVSLLIVLGLGVLVLIAVVWMVAWLVMQGGDLAKAISGGDFDKLLGFIVAGSVLSALVSMLTTPLTHLCITLFYLDSRVRREALDLEWAAHTAEPVQSAPYGAPPQGFVPGYPPQFVNAPPGQQQYPPQYPPNYAPQQPYPQQPYPPQNYAQPQGAPPQQYAPAPNAPQNVPASNVPAPPTNAAMVTPNAATPDAFSASEPALSAPQATSNTAASAAPFAMPSEIALPKAPLPIAPISLEAPSFSPTTQPAPTPVSTLTPEPPTVTIVSTPLGAPVSVAPVLTPPIAPETVSNVAPAIESAANESIPQAAAETVTCEGCGALSPRGQRFCMTCGAQLSAS